MTTSEHGGQAELIRKTFATASITITDVEVRPYPEEINFVVYVPSTLFTEAVAIANELESRIQITDSIPRFIIVRKAAAEATASVDSAVPLTGLRDSRVAELIRLVSARSRVSSAESSLVYVPDARASLSTITASRHHLVFGRRGAGKSALLVEARRRVRLEGALDSWVNVQTLRQETPQRVFLYILDDILKTIIGNRETISADSVLILSLVEIREQVRQLLLGDTTDLDQAERVVPRAQRAMSEYLELDGSSLYVFIDDFYYVPRESQPLVLDMLHGATRDSSIWLKIASIRHLTNWWQSRPPMGLQSGQDADVIDLDLTLQNPEKASAFLEGILAEYARRVGIPSLSRVFSRSALDRLVLASGAVPRDYMVLGMNAINRALERPNSKQVGVQDINQAAGDAANAKIQELEEDMASNKGVAERTLESLRILREFCLDVSSFTYFLVGYRDKEANPDAYNLLTDLMDVRLIHLVSASVSDAKQAGLRFEAYMLDLSQFSGSRLKQRINVLDFEDGHFVSKQTRIAGVRQIGTTARQLIGLLRRAPELPLSRLAPA